MIERDTTWRWSWIIALSGTVAVAFGTLFYAFSVLLTDKAAGADFSITVLSLAYGGSVLVGGGLAYWVGRFVDQRGVRPLVGGGAIGGAAGLFAISISGEPWQVLLAAWLLVGAGGAMTFYEPAFVALDQWFGDVNRARALAILTVIGGLAGPIFLPITAGLVEALGWRAATRVLSLILAATGLGASVFVLPSRRSDGRSPPARPSLRRLGGDARFVLFTLATFLMFGAMQAVFFHRIAVFKEAGFTLAVVTAWAVVSSVVSFAGRWGAPYVAGRLGPIRLYAASAAAMGGTILLMLVQSAAAMYGHFVTFGVVFGALLPLRAVVMAKWYSGPGYGAVMGAQWTFTALAGAAGASLTGVLRDAVGSYDLPIVLIATAAGMAAIFTFLSGKASTT